MNSTNQQKSLLTQAINLCKQRKAKLTPQRLEVLRFIVQQQRAISAYDLLDKLRIAKPQSKPPTVYRALDFLLAQGLIHRVESTNSYVLCHHFLEPAHTSVLFICDCCGSVIEYPTTNIKQILLELAKQNEFILRHNVVEVDGLCSSCADHHMVTNSSAAVG